MKIKLPHVFKGTQQNLYSISRLGWGYCEENLALFTAQSSVYTEEYVTDMLAGVTAAENLPSYDLRKDPSVAFRLQLASDNRAVLVKARLLWKYVTTAWPGPQEQQIKLSAAGYGYYRKASQKEWENTATMITLAKQFMAAYQDELTANDNMPSDFPTAFNTVATTFNTAKSTYISLKDEFRTATRTKYDADKAVFDNLVAMLEWGKLIFIADPVMKNKFTYDVLLKQVRGNDQSGVRGFTRETDGKTPIAGVLVRLLGNPTEMETDEKGLYEFHLPSGKYSLEFSKPGYQTLLIEKKAIEIGTMARLSVQLETVPAEMSIPFAAAERETPVGKDMPQHQGNGVLQEAG